MPPCGTTVRKCGCSAASPPVRPCWGWIAWVLLRTSRRLPIGTFFSASSALIAVLAIVLTGKGVAALQEAGWVAVSVAPVPHIELLGIYPTWQSLLAQLTILVLLASDSCSISAVAANPRVSHHDQGSSP
jgi:High-affinity Fe2+/Pb2+ permease